MLRGVLGVKSGLKPLIIVHSYMIYLIYIIVNWLQIICLYIKSGISDITKGIFLSFEKKEIKDNIVSSIFWLE